MTVGDMRLLLCCERPCYASVTLAPAAGGAAVFAARRLRVWAAKGTGRGAGKALSLTLFLRAGTAGVAQKKRSPYHASTLTTTSLERNAYSNERICGSVAPVVGAIAGVFAGAAWTSEQNAGLLCPGRRAGRYHAPAQGGGGTRGHPCGQDTQHRTPPGPFSGQSARDRPPAVDPAAGPVAALLARATPGLRAGCDGARRPCDGAVVGPVGPFPSVAGELAGAARSRNMGSAAVGGRRRAAPPLDAPPGSRRRPAATRSRPGWASAGPAVCAAWLAPRSPSVPR